MKNSDQTADSGHDRTRRKFLKEASAVGVGAIVALNSDIAIVKASMPAVEEGLKVEKTETLLSINGKMHKMEHDTRLSLLDALRDDLDLTGSKKGCDHGQCGACTVIVDGRRTLSCLTLAAMCDGKKITTIEGLADGDKLHPMQQAFIDKDGLQCGYCTPGQICSAVALLTEAKDGNASVVTGNLQATVRDLKLSKEEISERMSGNICRCGAYPNIVAAIEQVQEVSK